MPVVSAWRLGRYNEEPRLNAGLEKTEIAFREKSQFDQWSFPADVAKELAVLVEPTLPLARSVLSVVSQLQHMYVDAGVRSFCFIGDAHQSGTSVVAANAAAAFALSGLRTVLVDTNFNAPRIADMFGLDKSKPGLSEWLMQIGDASVWSSYMQPAYPNLIAIPAGGLTKDAKAMLATELRHFILELSRMFDVVICDAAPMSDMAGTLAVVSAVERTIIVARANKTRLKTLFGFQDVVRQCDGQIGGVVYLDY